MTGWARIRRNGLIALLSACSFCAVAVWGSRRALPDQTAHPVDGYPDLFIDARACPRRGDSAENGRRAEELARLRADRYPYAPRDGVRAVRHYQEAEACYLVARVERSAARVHGAAAALIGRVNTDYAAARLNLLNALEQERWSAALGEIDRLLQLTDHLERNEYVEWLMQQIGRVEARAGTES